jgi:hypothetical protein
VAGVAWPFWRFGKVLIDGTEDAVSFLDDYASAKLGKSLL